MKKLLFLLILFLSVNIGCAQTIKVPLSIVWDYDYNPGDNSTNIYFEIFQNITKNDTNYVRIDSTYQKELRLLNYDNLYTGDIRYIYCRAHRTYDDAISFNSDTIESRFPVILTNQPYEFIEKYIILKK